MDTDASLAGQNNSIFWERIYILINEQTKLKEEKSHGRTSSKTAPYHQSHNTHNIMEMLETNKKTSNIND